MAVHVLYDAGRHVGFASLRKGVEISDGFGSVRFGSVQNRLGFLVTWSVSVWFEVGSVCKPVWNWSQTSSKTV